MVAQRGQTELPHDVLYSQVGGQRGQRKPVVVVETRPPPRSDAALPVEKNGGIVDATTFPGTESCYNIEANAGAQDRLQVLEAGFQVHLAKPVEPTELVFTIAGLLKKSA